MKTIKSIFHQILPVLFAVSTAQGSPMTSNTSCDPGKPPSLKETGKVLVFFPRADEDPWTAELESSVVREFRGKTDMKVEPIGAEQRIVFERCDKREACLASHASAAGAAEVLVGLVSKVGDTVIKLRRIQAPDGILLRKHTYDIQAPRLDTEHIHKALGCLYPGESLHRYGRIRILSAMEGAEVFIQGWRVGVTPLPGALPLQSGKSYVIEIHKPGFNPFSERVFLPHGLFTVTIDARLSRLWYRHPAFWTVAAVLVGGAIASGVGAAYRQVPDRSMVPAVIAVE